MKDGVLAHEGWEMSFSSEELKCFVSAATE